MNMDFGANKTPVEVIKEGAFGGTYLVDIYSGINGKWFNRTTFRMSWKEFDQIIMMLVLKVEHHQDFEKIKVKLILQVLMVSFIGILNFG